MINKVLLLNLCMSLPEFLSQSLTIQSLLPDIKIPFFSFTQLIRFYANFSLKYVNVDFSISKIDKVRFDKAINI